MVDDRRLVRVWAQNLQKKELNTVSFYRVHPAFSAVLSSVRSLARYWNKNRPEGEEEYLLLSSCVVLHGGSSSAHTAAKEGRDRACTTAAEAAAAAEKRAQGVCGEEAQARNFLSIKAVVVVAIGKNLL